MVEQNDIATDSNADPFADMRSAKPWLEAIKDAEKVFEDYHTKCDNIDKFYADLKKFGDGAEREMQIFWANMEVLKPSIYARPPVPVVGTRFKDRKPINRHASEIIERCLCTSFEIEDIHETMKQVRDDLAASARGVLWVRYETDDQGGERVCYDHVDRRDFVHDPARKWKEVGWVNRKSYLTREQMRLRFEEASGDLYTKATYTERKEDDQTGEKKACVNETWSKTKNAVVWTTEGCDEVLDIQAPFLRLEGFYPCPRPVYGTFQRRTLRPVPDFLFYKDQVEEINELTARISALSEALKLKGFYSAGSEDVSTAIETAMKQNDNNAILIPVPNVAQFGGGSFKDSIIWMPVDQVAAVISQLVALRKQLIDDAYQISGLSDIMRGSSNPNETLGAQQLKSQYGNVRIRDRQEEMVRIARDAARIAGEIIAENFQPATLEMMSQYDGVPKQAAIQQQVMQIQSQVRSAMQDPQAMQMAQENPEQAQQMLQQAQQQVQKLQNEVTFEAVVQFIRDERMRPFALEIETDSTIQPDEDAAKQRTTEFLGALSQALSQLAPMVAAQPQSAEFASEVLKFAVAPFRAGRALEAAIDTFADQVKQTAQQPKEDPRAAQAKAEAEARQAELELKRQEMQMKQSEQVASMGIELEQSRADLAKTNAEIEKIMAEINRINAQSSAAVVTANAKANQPEVA